MAKRAPGWPFYPEDYERDTDRLRGAIEHGAYFLLLKYYWKHGALPDEEKLLQRIVGLSVSQWRRVRPILQTFFHDGWKHRRVERDLLKAARFRTLQSGRSRKRWGKISVDKNTALTCRTEFGQTRANPLKDQEAVYPAGIPAGSQYRIHDRLPSIAARETTAVDKRPPKRQARRLPNNSSSSREQRAHKAWEAELRHQLGYQHYGTAIGELARDPVLCARATAAEIKKPGSGVVAVLIGLKGRLINVTGDDLDEP